ncbi:MAG: energy transducer TonB [Flavobacteriales bacterium]|nr:MAG: energy transducer TonB [Flavobacteriales bacterium]
MRTPHLFLLLFLSAPLASLSAQGPGGDEQRQYLSEVLVPTAKKKAAYYREAAGREGDLFIGKTFTVDGKLKAEGTYRDAAMNQPHGSFVFYHPNGRVESRGEYINGNKAGVWERFDAWGQPLAEKIYNPEPLANIVYTRAQTMPQFRDGDQRALVRYVRTKVESQANRKVKGSYTTTFIVEKDGSLSDVKVIEGQDDRIGEQVAGAIKSTEPWTPGADKGQPVRVQMRVPVQF